jgi:hypothetical protein
MNVTYIALAAMIVFLASRVWRRLGGVSGAESAPGRIRGGVYSFLAGVLFANSIPHFIHGISGEYFPGPFFHYFGKGAAMNISNVLWGLFCFWAGCSLFFGYRSTHSPAVFRTLVCSGFICMSLFLSVVFSRGAFR